MSTTAPIPHRPLGLILNFVEGCGFHFGHAHEDLVFTEENVFLLKMEKQPELVSLYFNDDCKADAAKELEIKLIGAAREEGLRLTRQGTYNLRQADEKSVEVNFKEG